jgi:hypothetical protein
MRELTKHPWFVYLKDDSLAPRQRFAWAPCIVPFIMGYRDFTVEVIRGDPRSADPFEQALYTHSFEEDFHWHWLLEDLKKLGADPAIPMTETVRFLWSSDCTVSRAVPRQFAALCAPAPPSVKFCVVEACETISAYASKVFKQIRAPGDDPLKFFGAMHWEAEVDHSCHQMNRGSEHSIQGTVFSDAERARAILAVDETFRLVSELYSEWLRFAHKFAPDFRAGLDGVVETSLRETQARVSDWEAKAHASSTA